MSSVDTHPAHSQHPILGAYGEASNLLRAEVTKGRLLCTFTIGQIAIGAVSAHGLDLPDFSEYERS